MIRAPSTLAGVAARVAASGLPQRSEVHNAGVSEALATARRQATVTEQAAHRPWPLPERAWVMAQTWEDLLFVHWPVDPDQVRPQVPDGLELDVRDGKAWLGVTPFRLTGLRLRGAVSLPYLSGFLEINVRTYVTRDGKPGIWFHSLDATSRAAVEVARRAYRLPYHPMRATYEERGLYLRWHSSRTEPRARTFRSGDIAPSGRPLRPSPARSRHFLTERYCLYAAHRGELYRAEIHHPPWPLQAAEARARPDHDDARRDRASRGRAARPLLGAAGRRPLAASSGRSLRGCTRSGALRSCPWPLRPRSSC